MNRFILIFFLFTAINGFTQQIPFYNHHFINPVVYNPAYTGYNENVNAFLVRNSRNQSFDGGSINNYLTVDGGLNEGKYGLGLSVGYQTQGIQQQLGAGVSYSYKIKLNEESNLRAGLHAGFLDYQLDAAAINVANIDDPFLQELNRNKFTYNVSFGLLYSWKTTRIGLSIPQLMGNKVKYGTEDNRGFYQLERHYMLNLVQPINLTKDKNWSLIPNMTLRYLPGVALQYDLLLQADNKKWGWLAAGYKSDYAIEINAGIRLLNTFQLGYSYEYVIGDMAGYQSGMNHEIMLGYTFNNDKYKDRIVELEKKNISLEQTVSNNVQQIIDRNLWLEDSLARVNYLYRIQEVETAELLAEVLAYRKSLNQLEAEDEFDEEIDGERRVIPEDEKIIRTTGYNFVDLKNSSAPSGYYVINGVFSSRSNAINHLQTTKESGNPNAYLLLNKTNRFYYVILYYSTNDREAINARKEYNQTSVIKTWILEYFSLD